MVMLLWDHIVNFFNKYLWPEEKDNDENSDEVSDDVENDDEDHKIKLFEFLMKKDGPDFNIVDSDGWSPMSRAIDFGNVEILKLLL